MSKSLASFVVIAGLLLAPAMARADDTPATDDGAKNEALTRCTRALELYDQGDFRLALVELERAYALAPSPKLLFNIGQVHFQLGSYAKAQKALERYLSEAPDISEERRAQVDGDLAALRVRTARLTIQVNVAGADVAFDDQSLGVSPLGDVQLVDAGQHRITVSKQGFATTSQHVVLAGNDEQSVTLTLVPIATPKQAPQNTPALIGWISTGTLALAALGTGVATLYTKEAYDRMRTTLYDGSPESARDKLMSQQSLVNGLSITTDILAVTALLAGATSLYFTLRGPSGSLERTSY